jgi:hypothetical protein
VMTGARCTASTLARRIGVRRPQLVDSHGYNVTRGLHRSHFYAAAYRHGDSPQPTNPPPPPSR